MKKLSSLAAIAVVASIVSLGMSARANAGTSFDLNFSGATALSGTVIPNISNVNAMNFTASSVIGFQHHGTTGPTINAGDTFTDYTVLRVELFKDQGGANLTPPGYGSGPGTTNEITIVSVITGLQLTAATASTPGTYVINSDTFSMFYDFHSLTPALHNFTASNFNDLRTFSDSAFPGPVMSGTLGGISGGTNTNPASPNGSINVTTTLNDLMHTASYSPPAAPGAFFETKGGQPIGNGNPILLGFTSAHNQVTPSDQTATPEFTPLGGLNGGTVVAGNTIIFGFADLFSTAQFPYGLSGTQDSKGNITSLSDTAHGAYDLAFQTLSTGVITEELVPEPASMIVWSLVACGFGVPALRRRKTVVAG